MRFFTFAAVALGIGFFLGDSNVSAQPAAAWEHLEKLPQRRGGQEQLVHPQKFRTLRMNPVAIRQLLNRAPREAANGRMEDSEEISLPMPDGTMAKFRFAETVMMEPELAAKFPEIKTYLGQGIDDPSATVRFDINPGGFHAQIFSPRGAVYIDPYFSNDAETHVSFYKRDYARDAAGFKCLVGDEKVTQRPAGTTSIEANRSGTTLRTYRLACAATGEYTANRGGTASLGLAAVVTAVNRINQVYEKEIAVRLVLVANNNLLIYTNGGTDPYSNDDGFAMMDENQTNVETVIGSANYDIGHVFSTGGGGVASLGSVCNSSFKARGVTGSPSPVGDPFYIDYVAHEMGHQFGGNHTFNSETGSCGGGNRNGPTAYEPGSGTTIMAYAGICSPNNVQNFSDPYFHSASFDEIVAFLGGSGGLCAANSATGNTVPTVSAGSNFTIPKGTPFTLTATGSDANGDTLTYCWEQRDVGAAQDLTSADNGSSPLFRSFNPTTDASRTFPRLANILANTSSTGERLPTLSRTMKFRVTVRDIRPEGGAVNTSDMQVLVDGASGPLKITSPNTSVTWSNVQTVVWDVAGTAGSPVNCGLVNILLSTNGGNDFPIALALNTPNDGSQVISLPSVATSTARIKVQSVGNIFFDISDVNLSLATYVGGSSSIALSSVNLLSEGCAPTNNAIDPNESVQVRVGLVNLGQQPATNVSVTLLADAGVVSPSSAQNYGTLSTNATPVTRDFSFTASGACGATLNARFEIRTNGVLVETYTNSVILGALGSGSKSFTNSSAISIPTLGNASPYPSTINVSGVSGNVQKVTVTIVGLTHGFSPDLQVLLVGPGGESVVLMTYLGSSTPISSVNLVFDDAGSTPTAFATLTSGTYKPTSYEQEEFVFFPSPAPVGPWGASMSVFNNTTPNGTWSLYVRDAYTEDGGTIASGWRLNITAPTLQCCAGNSLPVIATISNRTINEDTSTGSIAFTVTDAETAASSLVVTASSSNTNLIPNANILLGGSGSNRTVTVTPAANQSGSSTITISANDGSGIATRTFVVTVNAVNDAPVLAAIANRTIHQGTTLTITNSATDIDTSASSLTYNLVSNPSGAVINAASGILTWTPATNQIGTNAFSVRVADNGSPNLSDSKAFSVVVVPRPVQSVSRFGNQLTLNWSALSGKNYQIQMKTNLNDLSWQNVTQVTASGSTGSFVQTISNQQKYYRILILE